MRNFYRYPYYRGSCPPPPMCPPPITVSDKKQAIPKPPVPPPPPCKPNQRKKFPSKKKLDFKSLKKDTCTSLNDVEHFLCNFSDFLKYIKLINLLK